MIKTSIPKVRRFRHAPLLEDLPSRIKYSEQFKNTFKDILTEYNETIADIRDHLKLLSTTDDLELQDRAKTDIQDDLQDVKQMFEYLKEKLLKEKNGK